MKNLQQFQEFISESYGDPEKLTAKQVADYISDITPEESDVPDYFISQIEKSGKSFYLRTVRIKDLLEADPSLREYVESHEERYGESSDSEHEPESHELDYPIVIFNGEVVDGYNRTSVHYHMGNETVEAYVSL